MGSLRTKSGPFFDAGFQLIRFEKSGGKKKQSFFSPKVKGQKWTMPSSKLDSDGLEIQHGPVRGRSDGAWFPFGKSCLDSPRSVQLEALTAAFPVGGYS